MRIIQFLGIAMAKGATTFSLYLRMENGYEVSRTKTISRFFHIHFYTSAMTEGDEEM